MVIKNFKLFEERAGGSDIDDDSHTGSSKIDIKNSPIGDNPYIIGVPSGEVIFIDDLNKLNDLISRDVVEYTVRYQLRNSKETKLLNCYCFNDIDGPHVKAYLDYENRIKNDEYNEKKDLIICRDFVEEMKKVVGRELCIAYLPSRSLMDKSPYKMSYVAIVPDLLINQAYYTRKGNDISSVLYKMMKSYPSNFFTIRDRVNPTLHNDIKYYKP